MAQSTTADAALSRNLRERSLPSAGNESTVSWSVTGGGSHCNDCSWNG